MRVEEGAYSTLKKSQKFPGIFRAFPGENQTVGIFMGI